jgi:hypothetical protein
MGVRACTINLTDPLIYHGAANTSRLCEALNQRKELNQLLLQTQPIHQPLVKESGIANQSKPCRQR